MEDIFFDFSATKDALGQLSTDLIALESSVEIRQKALQERQQQMVVALQEKEQKIESLIKTTKETIDDINALNQSIEGVL